MTQDEVKLTPEQESIIIKEILEYVDGNPYNLPGYNQLFNLKNAEFVKLKITQQQIKDFYASKAYAMLREIKDRFGRSKIRDDFKRFSLFYKWFIEQLASQDGKCYYCETSKSDLEKLFRSKGEPEALQKSKILYSTKPAFSSSFHIDRKAPKGDYGDNGNCVLACTFCNNAKSDMVKDAEIFKKNFGKTIHKFYKKLIDKDKNSRFCFIKILKKFTPF